MSIGSEYWRKEVESLKSQLQEKNEDLDSLKRSYDFNYENLKHLQDKLESCPVSGEVVVKLKGIYHTFFKAKINHPDYMDERLDETDRKAEELREGLPEIHRASFKLEASDGTELDPKDKAKGYKIFCENPLTGEKVLVKGFTDYDVLEARYKVECEENTRLLRRVAQQKSENEVLHRKVKDLCHKLRQARRERDELAEKLRIAEEDDKKRSLLIETLNQLLNEES